MSMGSCKERASKNKLTTDTIFKLEVRDVHTSFTKYCFQIMYQCKKKIITPPPPIKRTRNLMFATK